MRSLVGHETFYLEKPNYTWKVVSGAVGIFAVPWEKGEPAGSRHYLFTITADEYLLECRPSRYGLVAIAFEPTTLASYTPLTAADYATRIDSWFNRFSQIKDFPTPSPIEPNSSQYISLDATDRYCPHRQMSWVKIKNSGNKNTEEDCAAYWLSHLDQLITPASGLFPVGLGTWIEAKTSLELQSFSSSNLNSNDLDNPLNALHVGIEQFHSYALATVEQLINQQNNHDFQQFETRKQLNQQSTQDTLTGLASLLKPEDNRYLFAPTPLLIAAGAVGHAMGVEVLPPQASEDLQQLKEPLAAIARASQLRLRQVLLRGQWWRQDSGPMIVYRRADSQPMALLPIKDSRYELLDPLTLKKELVSEAVANQLDPRASVFYRPLPKGQLSAQALLKFAFQGHQRDVWMILATGIVMSALGMVIPQATAVLIDDAIPYGSKGLLIQIGLVLLAVALGRSCFQFSQAIAAMRLETSSDATLQAAVWDRLLKLPPAFFRNYATGDLQARVSSVNAIRHKLSGTALDAMLSGAFALLNLILMFYYSATLAALALFVALLVMSITIVSGLFLLKKQRPLLALDGELYGLMVQLINGVSKLRLAGAEPRAFAQWGQKYQQQLRLAQSTQKLEDAVSIFNTAMPTLTAIGLYGIATTLVDPAGTGGLSSGTFLAFSAAFTIFISGATSLSQTVIEVLEVIPLWMRSLPILQAAPEVDTQKSDPGRLTGRICVDHVTFRYREDGPLILDDVTIEARPGEFIALVGPSGSGKSTVLRLLLGFESPHSGSLYYDQQALEGLNITAVRRQLGVVLQNGRISAGSIFENISGGALITLEDAWQAAEMVGFADDIRSFPMEMHTVVSEGGGNLSGGQRQRLMIARALALNPQILLLDEATSALDNKTQTIVSESLDRLSVTRIVVAHRLSTIRNADRIYVIKSGRVVQSGSFDTLAQQEGTFKQLIKRQMA